MFLGWWRSRKRSKTPMLDHVRIMMYTRQGCHLCDETWEILVQYQNKCGFQLDATDVDKDAELKSTYGDCVPVVTVDGKVRFRGRVNVVLLKRLLAAKANEPTPATEPRTK